MTLHTVFANDGESSFQENFLVPIGADARETGIRHVAKAWNADLKDHASPEAYAATLEEFEVGPAIADAAMLALMDAVSAHLEDPADTVKTGDLRRAHADANEHRRHYEPA